MNSVLVGTGKELADSGRETDIIATDRHMAFTFTSVSGQLVTLKIVDKNGTNIYTESYTYGDSAAHSFYVNIDDSTQNYQAVPNPSNPRTGLLASTPKYSLESGNYSYTVTVGTKVVSSGEFTVA